MIHSQQDPMNFLRNMWGGMGASLPGMVIPTFDVDELEKRITDLKAVEGWLRMNLSMLQMTTQGLEMQKATLTAVHAMGKMGESQPQPPMPDGPTVGESLSQAALWPWNLMQQMQEQLQQAAGDTGSSSTTPETSARTSSRQSKREGA
ncbi:MAG: PhaM family polyhydroxyalkanoate granule multifunctional regulatory protein [Azovibrio sp.]|uniref:PhaM family polyhydroxyalkanoate granule multifunctional regulatory protein n=1 Tax=Azovibrio sp. TaxID=1872673 RepID=UPI003C78AB38